MTGSFVFNRQMSSAAGTSNVDKSSRRKLRRCSSADEHNSLEPILDDGLYKVKRASKRTDSSSDNDSGNEDIENQADPSSNHSGTNDGEHVQSAVFEACEDEGYAETRAQTPADADMWTVEKIEADLALAARVPDEEKKAFCQDTSVVFHAEFARLIGVPIALNFPHVGYHLCALEELPYGWYEQMGFGFMIPMNAKAQFHCTGCKRLWTSMRARIVFHLTAPRPDGWVVLEILSQECTNCGGEAEALWYMEEVCRVVEELANTIYQTYFPGVFAPVGGDRTTPSASAPARPPRSTFYNPKQRKGKMSAPHNRDRCQACKRGICFPPL